MGGTMKYLILALVFVSALLIGASRYATEGQHYAPIIRTNLGAGTPISVPISHCDLSTLIITDGADVGVYVLPASAPSGTICNLATTTDHNVQVNASTALFYESDGTTAGYVTCSDATAALGCFGSFIKLTADRWTNLGTPYGTWVWP